MSKKISLMLLCFLPLVMAIPAEAQLLLEENFNYSTGQLTSAGGGANVSGGNWITIGGTGNYILVNSGNLSYSGYLSSGTGNKIDIIGTTASAEDAYRAFNQPLTIGNTVYVSFLINLANTDGLSANSSTTGDYFAALLPVNSLTNYVNRVCIRLGSVANTFNLGLRATSSNADAAWSTADLAAGATYLVLMRYQMNSGSADDVAALFIDPDLSGAEPAPDVTQLSSLTTEPDSLGRIAVRQGSLGTPNAGIDGIRAGSSWNDIKGVLPVNPQVNSVSPANNSGNVLTSAVISVTFDRQMDYATMDTASFAVAGLRQARYYPDSIRPAANSNSYTFYVQDSLRKSDTVTVTLSTAIADTGGNHLSAPYAWTFRTLEIDSIRPLLVSSSPADGSDRVPVNTNIVMDFSEPLDPLTVDTLAFSVEGRRRSAYPIYSTALSSGNTRVTVNLTDTLYNADTITVKVKSRITDIQANNLRDTSFVFYTKSRSGITIYDLQYTTDPSGNSPYAGQTVTVTGVVTGVVRTGTSNGMYYIQDGYGPWNGIYCYDRSRYPSLGDSVRITGTVVEYSGITEMSPVSAYEVLKKNCALPKPVILPTDSFSTANSNIESLEGVLVATGKVDITALPNSYNEWQINDGSGACVVDDFLDSLSHLDYAPAIGESLAMVQGIFHYIAGWKIEPRFPKDVVWFKPVKLTNSMPLGGNTNVPTEIGIYLEFDKPLDTSTLLLSNFSITGSRSSTHSATLYYDSLNFKVTLTPTSAFEPGETVSVWISHSIRDTFGYYFDGNKNGTGSNDAGDDLTFAFTTMSNLVKISDVQKPGSDGFTPLLVGTTVTVEGIVSGPDLYFTSSTATTASWYLQDNTGGVNVYGGTKGEFALGRRVVVTGTVTEYNGVTEVASTAANIKLWDYAAELSEPRKMIYNQLLGESIEGQLVSVEGIISGTPSYAGGGYNMVIRNGNAPIAVRILEVSGFDLSPLTYGTKIRVTGIASQYDKDPLYNSGYQLIPRFAQDYFYNGVLYPPDIEVLVDSTAASASAEFVSIKPNPFSPEWGEVGIIEINAPADHHLTLRIYDLKGRLVKTCLNNVPGGHQYYYWTGKDDMYRQANIGIYIAHLRSVTAEGAISDKTKIIVLGTPLK